MIHKDHLEQVLKKLDRCHRGSIKGHECLCSRNNGTPRNWLSPSGHWTLTGDSAPGHRGSCWSQKHPAAEMGQILSCKFMIFPVFSYHFLCFTVTSTQQSSAPIGWSAWFFPPNRSPTVTKGTLAQRRHERNVGQGAILLGTNVLHHCKWFCGRSQDSKICHCN